MIQALSSVGVAVPVSRYRWFDLQGLERLLQVLLILWSLIILGLVGLMLLGWLGRNEELLEAAVYLQDSAASLVLLGAAILTVIAYCIWKYRATANNWSLRPQEGDIRPGWAVGWYFIPLANLVMPLKAMLQISPSFDRRPLWWWGLTLASLFCSIVSELLLTYATSYAQLRWALRLLIAEWITAAAACLVLTSLILEIGRWQRQERQKLQSSRQVPATA
ncbi:MAG TPA: DUF4328 domain-containing protein [Kiloniellales bacterium]|nr:DUF4328 domain-containing protein [Kiloniellales bacterium]